MKTNWTINDRGFARRFAQLSLAGDRKNQALGAMGNAIKNRVQLGFRLGQSPWGVPWKPINPAFRVGQPLRNKGQLQRSINSRVIGNAAVVGTNIISARVHQFGAIIRPRNAGALAFMSRGGLVLAQSVRIPARPFMPIKGNTVDLPATWRRSAYTALRKVMNL